MECAVPQTREKRDAALESTDATARQSNFPTAQFARTAIWSAPAERSGDGAFADSNLKPNMNTEF
jgi:hypothetical protein